MIEKVVSGGQTGVDRAALDVCLDLGIPCGGWCPKGRRAEDGPLHPRYPLRETPASSYPQRTEWNLRDSDGTLVLAPERLKGGTALTVKLAARLGKPVLRLTLGRGLMVEEVRAWIGEHAIRVLNVAGPRESERPGVYAEASAFLRQVLSLGPALGPR